MPRVIGKIMQAEGEDLDPDQKLKDIVGAVDEFLAMAPSARRTELRKEEDEKLKDLKFFE